MNLSDRRVLVTGGGTGLGAALARGFAAEGAAVVVAGRRRQPLDDLASSIPGIVAVVADVTDEDDVERLFTTAGPFDIVVANAGAAESAPITRTSLELWQHLVDVNLTGVFLTLREASRQLRGSDWGRLITIASTTGLRGYAYVTAYAASKHGAVGLTRSLAEELAGTGVTANALCPGYLATEMTERTIANIVDKTGRTRDEAIRVLAAEHPEARLVELDEVVFAALQLCGPGSDQVNGQAIEINGGGR